jgi:hypothetical protein
MFDPLTSSPLANAIGWLNGALFGTTAVTLCVIAVAGMGFFMLTGRVPVRRGLQVVLGCFILLGAPTIAATFTSALRDPSPPPQLPPSELASPRGDLPPAVYDPYAGASLRRD